MVLLDTLKAESHPRMSRVAVVIGVIGWCLATTWTVVLPILAILLAYLRLAEPGNPRPADLPTS